MLEPLLDHPLTLRLGWTLAHSLWQGALLAALLGIALRLVGRDRSALRHGLALVTLVAWLAAPIATLTSLGTDPAGLAGLARSTVTADAPPSAGSSPVAPTVEPSTAQAEPYVAAETQATSSSGHASAPVTPRLLPYAAIAWLFTAALLTLRLLGALAWVQRLRRHGRPAYHLEEALRALAERLGITRSVRLLVSTRIDSPATFGWLRPVVLLPASALTGLSAQQLELVIAHELAHIRRHDYLVNVLQGAAEALLFYHPVTWWLSRTLRLEREHACDDLALRATSRMPVELAETLARLEGVRPVPVPALASTGHLTARVRRLLNAGSATPTPTPAPVLLPLVTVLCLFTWLALAMGQAAAPAGLFERQPVGAFESPYSDPPENGWPTHRSPLDLISEAPFVVRAPVYVPAGYVFDNAVWIPEDQTATMTFGTSGIGDPSRLDWYLALTQAPAEHFRPVPIGAEAEIESVMVGTVTAGYVAGGWEPVQGDGRSQTTPTWSPGAWQLLAWQQGDMVFVLGTRPAPGSKPHDVERSELLRVAESLVAMQAPPSVPSDAVRLPSTVTRQWATLRGSANFGPEFDALTALSEGSSLTVEERSPHRARRVVVTPNGTGGFDYAYRQDGEPAEFDQEARAWYEPLLDELVLDYVASRSGLQEGATFGSLSLHPDRYELFIALPEERNLPFNFSGYRAEDVHRHTVSAVERAIHGLAHGLLSPSAFEVVVGYHLSLAEPTAETEPTFRYALEFLEAGATRDRLAELLGSGGG